MSEQLIENNTRYMREDDFRRWLVLTKQLKKNPISDAVSRCKRVCNGLNVNLDCEYGLDKGQRILRLLQYSRSDQKECKPAPGNFGFESGANLYNGLASLKNAVKLYLAFCEQS